MLEKLDSIPWTELQDAYGIASDIPKLIRALVSPQKEVRFSSRRELANRINRQGSCYQVTPFVVPLLFELIGRPLGPDRHLLIYDLVSIAIGPDGDYLPYDFDLEEFRKVFAARAAGLSDARRGTLATGPHIELECYESVNARSDNFVELARDDVEDVVVASIFALCWFPECSQAIPLLMQRLKLHEQTRSREVANCAISYALLCLHSHRELCDSVLTPLLKHPIPYVRTAGAIALARTNPSEDVVGILDEAAKNDEFQDLFDIIPFNGGDLQNYAAKVLAARDCEDARPPRPSQP